MMQMVIKLVLFAGSGTAEFAGVVEGEFFDCKSIRSGTQNISRWDSAEGLERITFKADGSASFAGQVRVQRTGDDNCFIAANGPSNGDNTVRIKADGSATFAGDLRTYGAFDAIRDGDFTVRIAQYLTGDIPCFLAGYVSGNAEPLALLTADGSASFENSIHTPGTPINTTNTVQGCSIYSAGAMYLSRPSGETAIYIKDSDTGAIKSSFITDGSAEFGSGNITLNADGSATFAGGAGIISAIGTYQAGGNPDDGGESGTRILAEGKIQVSSDANLVAFESFKNGTTAPTISFNSSGSAEFAGTVTANGTILTRSSGTLDVGDRLEKVDNALQALKTAAAASADFAALKSAIATALADI